MSSFGLDKCSLFSSQLQKANQFLHASIDAADAISLSKRENPQSIYSFADVMLFNSKLAQLNEEKAVLVQENLSLRRQLAEESTEQFHTLKISDDKSILETRIKELELELKAERMKRRQSDNQVDELKKINEKANMIIQESNKFVVLDEDEQFDLDKLRENNANLKNDIIKLKTENRNMLELFYKDIFFQFKKIPPKLDSTEVKSWICSEINNLVSESKSLKEQIETNKTCHQTEIFSLKSQIADLETELNESLAKNVVLEESLNKSARNTQSSFVSHLDRGEILCPICERRFDNVEKLNFHMDSCEREQNHI